jgi:hypothetical protein
MVTTRAASEWTSAARAERVGQGAEQDSVDQAEDRGVGADAKRKCQNGESREARGLRDHSARIANILKQSLHKS